MKYIYILVFLLIALPVFSQWNPNTSVNLEVAGLNVADQQTLNTSDGKTWIAFYNNNAGNYDINPRKSYRQEINKAGRRNKEN